MANAEHLAQLRQGSGTWNQWRRSRREVVPDLSGADLSEADLSGANLSGANLRSADLSDANLTGAVLITADLQQAMLMRAILRGALMARAILTEANLSRADLSGAGLEEARLQNATLRQSSLVRATLLRADLRSANLTGADLTEAALREAIACEADLQATEWVRVSALGANFTGAWLTGAYLKDNQIDSTTRLDQVKCEYVYLSADRAQRFPSNRALAPEELTSLLSQPTAAIALQFRAGIDWSAFLAAYQELLVDWKNNEFPALEAISNPNDDVLTIHLRIPIDANPARVEQFLKSEYERQLQVSQGELGATETIDRRRRRAARLDRIVQTLARHTGEY